jgi:hypothetical protein
MCPNINFKLLSSRTPLNRPIPSSGTHPAAWRAPAAWPAGPRFRTRPRAPPVAAGLVAKSVGSIGALHTLPSLFSGPWPYCVPSQDLLGQRRMLLLTPSCTGRLEFGHFFFVKVAKKISHVGTTKSPKCACAVTSSAAQDTQRSQLPQAFGG